MDEPLDTGNEGEAMWKKEGVEDGLNEGAPDKRETDAKTSAGSAKKPAWRVQIYPVLKDKYGRTIDGRWRERVFGDNVKTEVVDVEEAARKFGVPELFPYEIKFAIVRFHANLANKKRIRRILNELAEETVKALENDKAFKEWWDENGMTVAEFISKYSFLNLRVVYYLLNSKYQ